MMRIIQSLLFFLTGISAVAQQDPLYSQYINNPMVLNPAYTGLNDNFNASVTYRNQWAGFDGHPKTFNFNSHVSLIDNKVGVGLLFINDQIGSTINTEMQAAFSYKLALDEKKTFSFGMQTGFINFRNNYNNLNLDDKTDEAFIQGENITKPNLGVGVILKSDRFMLGASIPRLLSTSISVSNGTNAQDFQLYNRHLYLFGSYVYFLNENIRFKPAILLRAVKGSPLSVDFNFNVNFNEKYTAGAFIRNFNAYGVQVQTKLGDKLKLGSTFELPIGNSVTSGDKFRDKFFTTELFLGITLPTFDFHDRSISTF
ncbi:MAG: type IX secretion system membrane protein PorP/SprF [Cyclobacteriaceae bacterium]|nr:type IX secretion system membrane protein PorP/SprF [Cyclobacteriaceae bacterium]